MSGILIYSEKEAKRNIFAINKFKENLDIKLADENYDGKADFVINRTNNYIIAQKFEQKEFVFLTRQAYLCLLTTSSFAMNLCIKTVLKFCR